MLKYYTIFSQLSTLFSFTCVSDPSVTVRYGKYINSCPQKTLLELSQKLSVSLFFRWEPSKLNLETKAIISSFSQRTPMEFKLLFKHTLINTGNECQVY